MKLFVIYIGGAHEKSLIELHDMRFSIAEKIEDTYDELKKGWWGIPESLHLDAWGCLKHVENYRIELKDVPPNAKSKKLFFANLGGYDPKQFTELHKNVFVIAEDLVEAKEKAVTQISNWVSPHRDYQFELEKIFNVQTVLSNKNLYLHLEPTEKIENFEFTAQYVPIGRN